MSKESVDIISKRLGVEPLKLNSSLVSSQNRVRLYWTNIPNIKPPKDRKLFLTEVLVHNLYGGFGEKKARIFDQKSPTLRANSGGGSIPSVMLPNTDIYNNNTLEYAKKNSRLLTPEECEELQTVPIGYTSGVSNSQRYKMIGSGWTVSMIVHFFKQIKASK